MAHAFQMTVCAPSFVGDIALSYSNASLASRQEKEASVFDLRLHFDEQLQNLA
jgi:hypothetical protein